jgi:hypothetical protein
MKSKNIGLLISVVFIYGVFVIKETIANPGLLINREKVIYVIKHVAGTYFFATIFEIIILLMFLNHYHLKFKVYTYIPFIKLLPVVNPDVYDISNLVDFNGRMFYFLY